MFGRHREDPTDAQGEDVPDDEHVASSRDDRGGGGSYVGEQGSDDDIDAGQTGAEARAQQE
jgi:hypothetical protein